MVCQVEVKPILYASQLTGTLVPQIRQVVIVLLHQKFKSHIVQKSKVNIVYKQHSHSSGILSSFYKGQIVKAYITYITSEKNGATHIYLRSKEPLFYHCQQFMISDVYVSIVHKLEEVYSEYFCIKKKTEACYFLKLSIHNRDIHFFST